MDNLTTLLVFLGLTTTVWCGGRWSARRASPPPPPPKPTMFRRPALGAYNEALAGVFPVRATSRQQIERDLRSAGNYSWTAAADFLAKRNLATLLTVLVLATLFSLGLVDGLEIWFAVVSLVLVLLVFSLPRVLLSQAARRRLRLLEKGIPDALDMLSMAVDSGVPLVAALDQVARQIERSNHALAKELHIVARQASSNSLEKAFGAFAQRIELPEVMAWCSVMAQSHALGGRLVPSLEAYARRVRQERKQRAERAGNSASMKLLLPVVICLCPPIGIMLVGPAILDLREFLTRSKESLKIMEPLQQVVRPRAGGGR